MKHALDRDLQITLAQLDTEHEATEELVEEKIEVCHHLTHELDQELSDTGAHVNPQELGNPENTFKKFRLH